MDDVRIASTSYFIINLLYSLCEPNRSPTNVSLRLIVACVVNSKTRDPVGGARMDFAPLSTDRPELFVYSYCLVECPYYMTVVCILAGLTTYVRASQL